MWTRLAVHGSCNCQISAHVTKIFGDGLQLRIDGQGTVHALFREGKASPHDIRYTLGTSALHGIANAILCCLRIHANFLLVRYRV